MYIYVDVPNYYASFLMDFTLHENIKIVKTNGDGKSSIAIPRDLGRNHRTIKRFFDDNQEVFRRQSEWKKEKKEEMPIRKF